MSPRAVIGLMLVSVLVLGVLGVRVAVTRSRAQPVPLAVVTAPTAATSAATPSGSAPPSAPPPAAATGAPTATAAAEVVVHVVGRVRRPGVVRLPFGSRVQQAVAAAGGALGSADLSQVNLARPLVDGEQVVVPRPGEVTAPVGAGSGAGSVPGGQGSAPAATAGGQPVNLNTASLTELDGLPGVGPVLAQRILDWRAANGRFTSVDELTEVSGIGDAVLGRLRPLVQV